MHFLKLFFDFLKMKGQTATILQLLLPLPLITQQLPVLLLINLISPLLLLLQLQQ